MKANKFLLLSAFIMSILFACKKNDAPVTPTGPHITGTGKATDSISVGQSLTLQPQFSSAKELTFTWKVNGMISGADSAYKFTATTNGNYHIVLTVQNKTGLDSAVYNIHVWGKYENGFFMVHEGQYGVVNGDLAFYSYDSNKVSFDIFKKENPAKDLGPTTATFQYASIFNGKMYMVVKVGGPLVVADAYSMKETGRVNALPGDEGHAFTGIDSTHGLLSAIDGIYRVDLTGPAIGAKVAGINTSASEMLLAGAHVFAITEGDGIVILNASDYSIVKTYAKATIGFVRTKDGAIWAAGDSSLIRIDPSTLDTTETKLPFHVTNPWAFLSWRSGSMTASTNGNSVYLAARMEAGGIGGSLEYGGTQIYRYTPGDPSSLNTPFITLPDGQYFYGCAVRYNDRTNELVVISLTDMWGSSNDNRWLIYDATTGVLKNTINYQGYYFPAMPVFY